MCIIYLIQGRRNGFSPVEPCSGKARPFKQLYVLLGRLYSMGLKIQGNLRAPRAPLFRHPWALCNVLCPVPLMSLHDIRFQPLFEYEAYISYIIHCYKIICYVYAAVESEGPFTLKIPLLPCKHTEQTKMLVTCQRFGDLFLFGLVWQYSTNQNQYNKGRFKVLAT